MTDPAMEKGYFLGALLNTILLALLVASMVTLPGFPPRPGAGLSTVFTGVYLIAWGFMFLASYYFRHKTFLFRGLMWICERSSNPSSPKMAFFYFWLASVLGTIAVAVGRGLGSER